MIAGKRKTQIPLKKKLGCLKGQPLLCKLKLLLKAEKKWKYNIVHI